MGRSAAKEFIISKEAIRSSWVGERGQPSKLGPVQQKVKLGDDIFTSQSQIEMASRGIKIRLECVCNG